MSTLDRFRFDGQTSIVTGGNRGIGRGISEALAEAGADVVIANRDADAGKRAATEIAEDTGVETAAIPTDVTDEDEVAALVEGTVDQFGGVDVLVNNAGINGNPTWANELPQDEWQRVIDVNLTGAFYCAKHTAKHMMESGGGAIVNVSSNSAFLGSPAPAVAYHASKAGLEGLKYQLASEWARYDIRVNNVNPGFIRTDMNEEFLENPEAEEGARRSMLQDEIPTAEAIGPTVLYMVSDAAFYMTGESISVDGGQQVLPVSRPS